MPELPDIEAYVSALEPRIVGSIVDAIRLASPFVLRSVDPPIDAIVGRRVERVFRLGKRIGLETEEAHYLMIHLMVAGRLRWHPKVGAKVPGRVGLLAIDFRERGSLILTEASKKKRASLHLVRGEAELRAHHRGGLEPLHIDLDAFRAVLGRERHTLKRALTDQRLLSGIGNAYSDEILYHARLSPMKRSDQLSEDESARLFSSMQAVLSEWSDALRREAKESFPEKVTAFRPEMRVHGKYRAPCPDCGAPVQRIRYADNEANYCPVCQTEGRLLKDRSLSRLLKKSWPKTLEELEGD